MEKEGSSSYPSNDVESRNSVLDYISQVLMEDEDVEGNSSMLPDALALQATEKSLYEVLGGVYPPTEKSLDNSGNSSSIHPPSNVDLLESNSAPSFLETQTPILENMVSQSTPKSRLPSKLRYQNISPDDHDLITDLRNSNYFHQSEWVLQFNKGVQEASKFLPKLNNLTLPSMAAKKNRERGKDEVLEEARNNKQSAVSVDENELSDLFDKVVISPPACTCGPSLQKMSRKLLEQKEQIDGARGGKALTKKEGDGKEVVDLWSLLIICAQAVSSNDFRSANEHLKQIRRHSSCSGDGFQRLAHVFADALEARIAGTGTQIYAALSSKERSAAEALKAYQLYISACPFERGSVFFANRSIVEIVKVKKATILHIIDFGIFYGFHLPSLIMCLLKIHGGPFKLRITGIDIPMPGFRPLEAVQETGRRLASYCKKFNVPFEYNGIAQQWETIQVEDLNPRPDEVVVVNCLNRLHNLLDDSVVESNPRDAVLNLIRKINPDMFIHSVINGLYVSPFFVPRFRDLLYHNSSVFDMFDSRIPREDEDRLIFEQERLKRIVVNVVACEGSERLERPESYKQWQVRTTRAGFTQRALDHNLVNQFRDWIKDVFLDHDDFTVETDGEWVLQGWKGRILFASSIWLPAMEPEN